jgi:DNA-binding NtrC family response regulator
MASRILFVDDDAPLRYAMAKALIAEGFEVVSEGEFGPVLVYLESKEPLDLLITDVVMPDGINGLALARMAKARRKDLKVIYVTAFDVPDSERDADMIILRKPISHDELMGAVKGVLATGSTQAS